ncbi:hypothetical protein BT63DRAFT_456708 [Microthyrium microscopicum]|uniref:Uncharacterized protein n=1 Tax=Microthyrium microscopicum TaxID=703497 RepID=A0A6A6U8I0_9PEZI|nr:hypothetical protein BT63DRAFT_456708 [Microthyrium microscopicum]
MEYSSMPREDLGRVLSHEDAEHFETFEAKLLEVSQLLNNNLLTILIDDEEIGLETPFTEMYDDMKTFVRALDDYTIVQPKLPGCKGQFRHTFHPGDLKLLINELLRMKGELCHHLLIFYDKYMTKLSEVNEVIAAMGLESYQQSLDSSTMGLDNSNIEQQLESITSTMNTLSFNPGANPQVEHITNILDTLSINRLTSPDPEAFANDILAIQSELAKFVRLLDQVGHLIHRDDQVVERLQTLLDELNREADVRAQESLTMHMRNLGI